MHMIPFLVTIPPDRRDPRLTEKLLAERDGISRGPWPDALRGSVTPSPPPVFRRPRKFRAEVPMGRWIDERCVAVPTAKSCPELFAGWKQWASSARDGWFRSRRFSDLMATRDRRSRHRRRADFNCLAAQPAPCPPYHDD